MDVSKVNKTIIHDLNSYFLSKYNYNFKYKGVLYGSYIKTHDNKIKIIEFNARLGDPEAINIFLAINLFQDTFTKLLYDRLFHQLFTLFIETTVHDKVISVLI